MCRRDITSGTVWNFTGGLPAARLWWGCTNPRYVAPPRIGAFGDVHGGSSARETLADLKAPAIRDTSPHGTKAYALYEPQDDDFIASQGLQIVYRGRLSNAVIAVQPDLAHFDSHPKANQMGETAYDDTHYRVLYHGSWRADSQ